MGDDFICFDGGRCGEGGYCDECPHTSPDSSDEHTDAPFVMPKPAGAN